MNALTLKSTPLIVLAALLALLIAGCGGGSSDSTDATVESQPPPAGKAPAATGKAEDRGHAAPGKQVAAKKPPSKQARQETKGRKGAKARPRADGKAKKTVDQKLEAIIENADGANNDKPVVSSPKEIRKVLDELKEESNQGGNASESSSVEQTLEKVLGGS